MSLELTLYTKENCHLCEVAKEQLQLLHKELDIKIKEVDIYKDDELLELYGLMIPVVALGDEVIQYGKIEFVSIYSFLNSKT